MLTYSQLTGLNGLETSDSTPQTEMSTLVHVNIPASQPDIALHRFISSTVSFSAGSWRTNYHILSACKHITRHLIFFYLLTNKCIDSTSEITSNAPTNEEKHVSQALHVHFNANNPQTFGLLISEMTLYLLDNWISDGPTIGLSNVNSCTQVQVRGPMWEDLL